jgi:arabinose-5-phosphate isomerase
VKKLYQKIQDSLRATIQIESESVQGLFSSVNDEFIKVVKVLHHTKGRIVISGIGKSAIVAQKIVATLNSTGSPAIFLHAADAIHGDIGMVREEDIVIIISNSGNTPEIKILSSLIKEYKHILIAISGNASSYLAQKADYFISTQVEKEACPNNLAPTSSTTTQMVAGDAIAVALLQLKGFNSQDFAKFHPGGLLGKKMYLRVQDLSARNAKPSVEADADLKQVIFMISSGRLGAAAVIKNDKIIGIITDGDLRRMLEKEDNLLNTKAIDIMSTNPKTVTADTLVVDALQQMKKNHITQLIVAKDGLYEGIIHLHDIINEGIV